MSPLKLPLLLLAASAFAAPATEWKRRAALTVEQDGLVRAELPLDAVSAARADLSDLRVFDAAGAEVPYLVDRKLPEPYETVEGKIVVSRAEDAKILMLAEFKLPPGRTAEALRLETPTPAFLAAASVELTPAAPAITRRPVFRQEAGPECLELRPSPGRWTLAKVSVEPIGGSPQAVLTGLSARLAPRASPTLQRLRAEIVEQASDARQTRLRLKLPAANLWIDSVAVETVSPLFTRRVEFLDRSVKDGVVRESPLGAGTIFRVPGPGDPGERLAFDVRAQAGTREAVLRVQNGDSPPLSVSAVWVNVVPAQLVFLAKPGVYTVAVGNDAAAAPQYDLGELKSRLESAPAGPAAWGAVSDTPGYAPREPLAGVEAEGGALDVSDWPYRKKLSISKAGAQAVVLDAEVLARERAPYSSLRVMRGGKQVPFISDEAGVERQLEPQLHAEKAGPGLSRWSLALPSEGLPLTYLTCSADKPLFQRRVSVVAQGRNERGDAVEQRLATAEWTRLLGQPGNDLSISLAGVPPSRRLSLEIQNGDNAPLTVSGCKIYYRTQRLLFKASPGADVFLYYGRENVSPPVYDLRLAAAELFAASANEAAPGPEENLGTLPWWQATAPTGAGKWLFWGALTTVVAILLVVIAKLLPEPPAGAA